MSGGVQETQADNSQMDDAHKSESTEEGSLGSSAESDYNSVCWNCSKSKTDVKLKLEKCEGCQKARYCSRECWEEDQPVHGPWCRNHCWGCEKTGVKLPKCGGCLKARYCNRECIVRDWKNHQDYCLKQQQKRKIEKK